MKKSVFIRAFFGLAVVMLGVILLLQNFGIINDSVWEIYWGVFWSLGFAMASVSGLFSSRGSWVWGVLLV